ncbi:MAG: 4a-hydroxytetrahydrobiopterin dehydratase [Nocardioides sp.]
MAPTPVLTAAEVLAADGLADWRMLYTQLHASYDISSYAAGAAFVAKVAALADEANHHPDVELRYGRVDLTLSSHDVGGVTGRDLALARQISAAAGELTPRPERLTLQELAIDAVDADLVRPFWVALLGYAVRADGSLADPAGRLPTVWFQAMDPPRTERNRLHLDVFVPPEVAEERVAAAVAAGGRLLSDAEAPSFWVLADPEGNEACVCTCQEPAG